MIPKQVPFKGYLIEIHEHPTYHDYEFVIKDPNDKIIGQSAQQYTFPDDAEVSAKMRINEMLWPY